MMGRFFGFLVILGVLISIPGQSLAQSKPNQSFKSIVEEKFDSWDKNQNGKLEPQEIDHLIRHHSIKGNEAAAVASIHVWFRGNPNTSPKTKTEILETKDGAAERTDLVQKAPHLNSFYKAMANHLDSVPRTVFSDNPPRLEDISQGHIGDCFFISIIGPVVHRNPAALKHIIQPGPNNGYTVTFPNGQKTHVAELTDSLICLGSTARQSGIWLNILEEGYGQVAHTKKPGLQDDPAIDRIAKGGQQTNTIPLLTGRKISHYNLKKTSPAVVHQAIAQAEKNHLVMGATISHGVKLPPGVAAGHAYGILGIENNIVRLWNPWGSDFTPQGTPGKTNGYTRKHGIFEMPLHDFCEYFSGMTIESH